MRQHEAIKPFTLGKDLGLGFYLELELENENVDAPRIVLVLFVCILFTCGVSNFYIYTINVAV